MAAFLPSDPGMRRASDRDPPLPPQRPHAAERLRLARAERVLAYTVPDEDEGELPFLEAMGFRELTRTRRGWHREP